jgi:NCS1 family nucleobase:cation symporter-1
MEEDGEYYYSRGYNPVAVRSVIIAGFVSVSSVLVPRWTDSALWISDYSWFIGCGVGFVVYALLAKQANVAGFAEPVELAEAA